MLRGERGELRKEVTRLNKKLDREAQSTEKHKETIRRQFDEDIKLRAELRRRRDQADRVRSLTDEAFWLRLSLEGAQARKRALQAKLAKLLTERKTLSKPIAGPQLRAALRRSRHQKKTIQSQSKEIRRLRGAVRASEVRKGALTAKLAKLIAARKTLSKPIAGTHLRVALKRSRRQKQTITSQSKEIRRLRKALRSSETRKEVLEAQVAKLRAVGGALSVADADLRKALRRSRRQKGAIKSLSRENARLRKAAKTSQARIGALEAQVSKLRAARAALSKRLFGKKSEKQEKPPSGRKRGQQRGAPGHGRTQRPRLEGRREEKAPPEDARVCSCCGKPYAPNGAEETTIVEIEVKAHKRRIVRPRWRRACECASSPQEVIAPAVPRLFDNTPYGISVWARYLYERYACFRPLKRVAAWMSDQGLAISPGTLGSSVKRFVPLFKPVAKAIFDRQNEAAVRHGDETGWRIRSLRETGRSVRAWLWTSVTEDAVYFHSDASRSAEVAKTLFGGVIGIVILVCDRLSTYKKLARELDGKMTLQWCWSHQRRDFIDCAGGQVRLTEWCQGWIERIAEIYHLNDERLKHYDPGRECQTPEFDTAQSALKKALDALFAEAERELSDLPAGAREGKALRSLLNHREGLCVFVDQPQAPMDNNKAELALRGPAIGRRLSFGSDSELGAEFTAMMYTVVGTLKMNGIDVLRWLRAWLTECAANGGQPPEDLEPWLPWSMSEERRREFMAPA